MVKRITLNLMVVLACSVVAACSPTPEASSAEQAEPIQNHCEPGRLALRTGGKGSSPKPRTAKRDGGAFDVTISVAGACSRDGTGTAKAVRAEGDVEVKVNPDGEGHPTDDFTLSAQGKCRVTIRLAAPERDFAFGCVNRAVPRAVP